MKRSCEAASVIWSAVCSLVLAVKEARWLVNCGSDSSSLGMAAICRGSFSYLFLPPFSLVHRTLGPPQKPLHIQWQITSIARRTCVAMALVILSRPLVQNPIRLILEICGSFTASQTDKLLISQLVQTSAPY